MSKIVKNDKKDYLHDPHLKTVKYEPKVFQVTVAIKKGAQ